MNKKTYRILALVLALAMGLGVAGIALADATFRPSSGTAYATDAVNVRSGPGTSYTVLGYLSRGRKGNHYRHREQRLDPDPAAR